MEQERIQVQDQGDFWFCYLDLSVMTDTSLSVYEKAVYAALCSFASVTNSRCYPSLSAIAERASCSKRKTQDSLVVLEEAGYIARMCRSEERRTSVITLTRKRAERKNEPSTMAQGAIAPHAIARDATTMAHGATGTIATNDIEPAPTEGASAPGQENSQETHHIPEPESEPEPNAEPNRDLEPADLVSPQEAPSVFRETVELFCHKTGRRGITREELGKLRDIGRLHTPARIQREITTALERFGKKGRDPGELTFGYLWEALRYQKTLRSGGGAQPPRKAREITEEDREEWGIR